MKKNPVYSEKLVVTLSWMWLRFVLVQLSSLCSCITTTAKTHLFIFSLLPRKMQIHPLHLAISVYIQRPSVLFTPPPALMHLLEGNGATDHVRDFVTFVYHWHYLTKRTYSYSSWLSFHLVRLAENKLNPTLFRIIVLRKVSTLTFPFTGFQSIFSNNTEHLFLLHTYVHLWCIYVSDRDNILTQVISLQSCQGQNLQTQRLLLSKQDLFLPVIPFRDEGKDFPQPTAFSVETLHQNILKLQKS